MDSDKEIDLNVAFRPLLKTGRSFYVFMAILLAAMAWWLYNVYIQVTIGAGVQGLGTKGAIWGSVVANIVYLIGISHVGIAISASVRIMNLKRYKPLARIAELVTLVSMTAAVINIGLDVGRPERFIKNVVLYGRWQAPFVWSMTVISWYVVGSSIYLYLAMRRDLCIAAAEVPKRRWLYRLLAIGYSDTEQVNENHERTVRWCAIIILPIMVSVHSVYGFIFGLQVGRPGWYNPIQAPYFVLGAIVTGFSAIIIIAAIVRRIFGWYEIFPPRMFKGLGIFLGFVTFLYIYFLFSELLTGQYSPPEADLAVFNDILWGRFAYITWPTFVGGLFIPFWMLFVQGVNRKICSITLTVIAAVLINIALWMVRYLIVVPSFYHPHLPYKIAPYIPTLTELTVMLGTEVFAILFFVILIKLLPVIELPMDYHKIRREDNPAFLPVIQLPGVLKKGLIYLTFLLGIGMIIFGLATREYNYAPVKWLTGIFLLCVIPLEICLIQSKRKRTEVTTYSEPITVKQATD